MQRNTEKVILTNYCGYLGFIEIIQKFTFEFTYVRRTSKMRGSLKSSFSCDHILDVAIHPGVSFPGAIHSSTTGERVKFHNYYLWVAMVLALQVVILIIKQ